MSVTFDPLTNGDFEVLNTASATAGWSVLGSMSMIAIASNAVEGTSNLEARVNPGVGTILHSTTRDWSNTHMRVWLKLAQSIDTLANGGARCRLGDRNNYGEWTVYGSERQVVVYNGWMMLVADVLQPFVATGGTPPPITNAGGGIRLNWLNGNGKDLDISDALWLGNFAVVRGGTTGARGTFNQLGIADEASGFGIVRPVGGVYFSNAGLDFGDGVGTETSYFEDVNRVLVFEDLPVSGTLYRIRHVGNANSINHFQLGSTSGTGVDQDGAAGGVIQAAGQQPFRIEAVDTNIDAANYYGVTMLGPVSIYNDAVRTCFVASPAFADDTRDFNDAGASDVSPFPSPAVNDAFYLGHDERFYTIDINVGLAKTGNYTIVWEYYNGTTWQPLTDVTDGTNGLTTTGSNTISYAIPDDWTLTSVNSVTRYWVRARISAFTSTGTVPLITEGSVTLAGDIRWESPNGDIVGCTLTNMGSIRIRNGAFVKRTVIDSSIVPAKHAAIDLGSVGPATDTVRDLTIQNCATGILLKGSSTGTTTYNFQHILFANNTNDVRVDFPAAATIVINVVEDGDTPTIDNVNGSTVVINNTVIVSVTVLNSAFEPVVGARVLLEAAAGGNLAVGTDILAGITDASGVIEDIGFNFTNNQPVIGRVRRAANSPYYKTGVITGSITTAGFNNTVILVLDE